jgi:uracil-DNA glycosylase family 4
MSTSLAIVVSNPLYDLNRGCTACDLRKTCAGPVPAVGPTNARVMFVGEAPGQNEDRNGIPFIGPAGQFLDELLFRINLDRDEVWITNTAKCRPIRNRTPSTDEAKFCADRWLANEIEIVQPEFIVTLGRPATSYILSDYESLMEEMHNIPVLRGDLVVLPIFHPASALHGAKDSDGGTARIRQVMEGFQTLEKLLNGESAESLTPVDVYPDPKYVTASTIREAETDDEEFDSLRVSKSPLAVDVETEDGRLWSVQETDTPGQALFFQPNSYGIEGMDVVLHNFLFDADYIDLSLSKVYDTMVMAYLLGLPQGLKALARTYCGMVMESYQDITRPYRRDKALAYLQLAEQTEWPDPVPDVKLKWSNKDSALTEVIRNPQHINKKIARILADVHEKDADPWDRWHKIEPPEREELEASLGPMPDAFLSDVPRDKAVYYASRDPDATLRVFNALMPMIDEQGLRFVLESIDLPTLPIVHSMMTNGIKVDRSTLQEIAEAQVEPMLKAAAEAHAAVPPSEVAVVDEDGKPVLDDEGLPVTGTTTIEPFNPKSDVETAKIVYGVLGFKPTAFTKKERRPQVNQRELKKVNHPVIKPILTYRKHSDIRSRVTGLMDAIMEDGCIHTTFTVTRTETGRLSSRDPNVQNINVRDKIGKLIRAAFEARYGYKLMEIDFSQIEMRVAAHIFKCQRLITLFSEKRDVHAENAAIIWGIPLHTVTEAQRYPMKRAGFGVLYGLTSKGLSGTLTEEDIPGWDVARCREFITDYFRLHPEISDGHEELKAFARRNGYVADMFGRRRWIPELIVPNKAIKEAGERQAINMPVQSGAQGVIKLAANRIWSSYPLDLWKEILWLLQIHDSLIWDIPAPQLEQRKAEFIRLMETTVSLSVPTPVEAATGDNWAEL